MNELNWSIDTMNSGRKTSLLCDEREPDGMMDSDITQQSMDSLDDFNSDHEFIKLERSRTVPVSMLYDAIDHGEQAAAARLASGRSLSMGSLGSLWDSDYKQRASEYDKKEDDVQQKQAEKKRESPNSHAFRLHTPIPEEACSSGSNESITYVFMSPSSSSCHTNPSSILNRRIEDHQMNGEPDIKKGYNPSTARSIPRPLSQQPRTLSMDSIDVEHCMNIINRNENFYHVETPTTTLERKRPPKLRREHSGIQIESTDQEYPNMEPTPYLVESATTDQDTGPEPSPKLWNLLASRRPRHDSGSDYDCNDSPGRFFMHRPQSQNARRTSSKTRRSKTSSRSVKQSIETQTDDYLTGYSSQPSSPGCTRRGLPPLDGYALMRSLTSGAPLSNLPSGNLSSQLEPTVHLLTEVVSLMKIIVQNNLPLQRCQQCQQCICSNTCLTVANQATPPQAAQHRPRERPNTLNLTTLSDTASSDASCDGSPVEPEYPGSSKFKEGFLIERFKQSRQDRFVEQSLSDIPSCISDGEGECDSLNYRGTISGASTPTDEFRTFPTVSQITEKTVQKTADKSPTDAGDSGISDRWESQGSSCGSTTSNRKRITTVSSDSMSVGTSSLSSTSTPDSSLSCQQSTQPILTQWTNLSDKTTPMSESQPARTSTPVPPKMTTWAQQARDRDDININSSTETSVSYKTTKSHFSNNTVDSCDEAEVTRKVTRPSKLALLREKRKSIDPPRTPEISDDSSFEVELMVERKTKPLDDLKRKWQVPYDLFPSDSFIPFPSMRLRCSPDMHKS